jgi:polyhydroxyalkanoate synthesis regulator phasin
LPQREGAPSVAAMTENDGLRRYVEAATTLTQITKSRAEELVRELIKTGEIERHRAQEWVEDLVKASRDRSEALMATVRGEVRQQLKELGFTNVDDLAKKVADILARSSEAGRKATHRSAAKTKKTAPKKTGPTKTGAAKKTPRKAAGAKKAGAKKAGAKKAGAKKAGA